ncbi:hypothetical protein Leryth_009239 [Lithospermum erythrorhizon]|nr:hypothetical protein Leryth_009239 [Lithospermum erythrorhizon]
MVFQRNSTKASPKRNSTSLRYLLDLDSRNNFSTNLFLSKNPEKQYQQHLISEDEEILNLISICSSTYTFTNPLESPSHQDFKRLKLMQLLSIIKTKKIQLSDEILPPLFKMVSSNLFRDLPAPPNNSSVLNYILPEEDENIFATPAASWPHLQTVYQILLLLVTHQEPASLRKYIDQSFLLNLLSTFQSEDPRERESLKNVFHRIYSTFTFYRAFMRKAMSDVFLQYIFETMDNQRHSGIGDLLEIWGSIINGFAVPLKDEHKLCLKKMFIPLHKHKCMQVYHKQLSYCISQFVQKEPALIEDIIKGVLRYWPVSNIQKEVLMIGEVEELVENIDPEIYKKLALPLWTQIAKCLNSCNSQVAERALYLWNNEQFVNMASQARENVFPIIVKCMEKNLKSHWSNSVRQSTENVKGLLEESEPFLYSKCLLQLESQESATQQEEMRRKEKWGKIAEQAENRNQNSMTSSLHPLMNALHL